MLFKLFILALAAGMLLPPTQTQQFDLLIRNGSIVDGSGRAAYSADLAVKGDRIVAIGNLSQATATRTIDARGLVVSPGFIDMLGQSETYVLIDPRVMSKVMMGVTTEITGEGESIAPINERQIRAGRFSPALQPQRRLAHARRILQTDRQTGHWCKPWHFCRRDAGS